MEMTIGMLLDAIDYNREGYCTLCIKDNNGCVEMQAKTSSFVWDSIENKVIKSLCASDRDVFDIWIKND